MNAIRPYANTVFIVPSPLPRPGTADVATAPEPVREAKTKPDTPPAAPDEPAPPAPPAPLADLQACLAALADASQLDLRPLIKNPLLRERIAFAIRDALAELHFHQCDSCGEWLVLGKGFLRETARYCNGACRQREYTKRQKSGGQKAGGMS